MLYHSRRSSSSATPIMMATVLLLFCFIIASANAAPTAMKKKKSATATAATECDVCASERDEYCSFFPSSSVCSKPCGFVFDAVTGKCWEEDTVPNNTKNSTTIAADNKNIAAAPAPVIIGGQGKYRYQYMPNLLQPPAGASYANCHGLSVDADENIILTYQHAGASDPHCIIRWNADGTGGEFAPGDTPALCSGTPHGLKITTEEGGKQFLYHANNAQKLAKTDLDGNTVWMQDGPFGQNMTCGPDMCPNGSCRCSGGQAPYIPTWFATPPNSDYMYLCDGYGSDRVFAFERSTGRYMNKSWGGRSPAGLHPGAAGPTQPHGKFMENHGCTYDPRPTTDNNT